MQTLWTIGYQLRAQHDVIDLLVEAGVELLVDVRLRPLSRKPGLSKTALGNAARDAGIAYEHRRELGTPLDIRGLFRAGELEQARSEYEGYLLSEARSELEWLADHVGRYRTAILCFELDHRECHRSVIAQQVAVRSDVTIVNL